MADFTESFRKGIAAARVADRNQQEIQAVFKDLNDQIAKVTDGKVVIGIRTLQRFPKNVFLDIFKPPQDYRAIVGFNPQSQKSGVRELAEWFEDRAGYPCKIKFGLKEISCEDKEGLEAGLRELLEDPIIGSIIYRLTQLEAEVKQVTNDESVGEKETE